MSGPIKLDRYEEYWREAVMIAFEEAGGDINALSGAQWDEVACALRSSEENMGQAFHIPENPLRGETERLTRKLKWERERETCGTCAGRGRIEYSAGPWGVNSPCPECNSAGKVHPRGEREPA